MHIIEKKVSSEISKIKVEPSIEVAILKTSKGSFSVKYTKKTKEIKMHPRKTLIACEDWLNMKYNLLFIFLLLLCSLNSQLLNQFFRTKLEK